MRIGYLSRLGILLTILVLTGACSKASDSSSTEPRGEPETAASDTTARTAEEDGMVTTPSGLKYKDIVEGTGDPPGTGDIVSVHYTGWLKNGTKFDSSHDRGSPIKFTLGAGQVIKGWDEGLATMKAGGRRKLEIPPELAYGPRSVGDIIPPNSVLTFDVELLEVQRTGSSD